MKQRLFYGTKDYNHQDVTHLKDHTGQKHQNIKKQCACVQSCFSHVTLCHPIGSSLPGFSVHGIDSPRKNAGVGSHALQGRTLPDPGIDPASLCLLHCQVGSLPLVPPGKT